VYFFFENKQELYHLLRKKNGEIHPKVHNLGTAQTLLAKNKAENANQRENEPSRQPTHHPEHRQLKRNKVN